MRKVTVPTLLAGMGVALAIGAAPIAAANQAADNTAPPTPAVTPAQPAQTTHSDPALPAQAQGSLALPPGGQITLYPQDQPIGGANPLVPFGTDPFVPNGVWAP